MVDASSLGEYLRSERENRGISLEQIASATKIGIRQLHALEADQYAELPAQPFIRGFVIAYTRFIGVDPKEVLTRFGDFIEKKAHERPNREAGHSGYAFEKKDGGEQSRTILWIIMGTFVVLGVIFIVVFKPALKHKKGSHVDKLREVHGKATPSPSVSAPSETTPSGAPAVVPPPAPVATISPTPSPVSVAPVPAPEASPVATPASSPSPQPGKPDPLNSGVGLAPEEIKHKVVLKALEDIWVRYRADDRPPMRIILRKDRVLVLRAQEAVRLQVSDPKSASFNYNSGGYKPFDGDKNVVVRQKTPTLYFPPNLKETPDEPFPGQNPLSGAPPAPWRGATSHATDGQ